MFQLYLPASEHSYFGGELWEWEVLLWSLFLLKVSTSVVLTLQKCVMDEYWMFFIINNVTQEIR